MMQLWSIQQQRRLARNCPGRKRGRLRRHKGFHGSRCQDDGYQQLSKEDLHGSKRGARYVLRSCGQNKNESVMGAMLYQ